MTRARIRQPRRRSAGFTLVELMVALVVGALVVAAIFTLGGASAHHFQEQQRVGVTQRAVRMAMDRVRRDLSRAGYLSAPSSRSPFVRTCPSPAPPRNVDAVWFADDDVAGNAALDTVNRSANGVSTDRLRLIGNYATGDQYLVRTINTAGNQIFLQTDWLAFRRSFVTGSGASATVDTQRFDDVFRAGRMLHIETRGGFRYFVDITGSTVNSSGTVATVSISPGLGVDNPCLEGLGRGALVAPLSEVEYFIGPPQPGSNLAPRTNAVTGPNTILYRRELNMDDGSELAGTRRPILEFAVDFNLDFIVDTNLTPTNPPNIQRQDGPAVQNRVQNQPWQVRGAVVSLAARTPEQDRRFPWPDSWGSARPATAPLNRYQVFPGQEGAARVRQLTTEVSMPNMVPR
ncbi:MAG TPA: prepilin-type N-terminal cleavage/methylation domain-containing protein [Sandaracinaceae bacterium LLY-WYZ-13_1]|nr:prepilin-type N-terminal cleavage/methylation domain-containing protein [Sandaracinaceae bacterium LLY-WYZ-13_1]